MNSTLRRGRGEACVTPERQERSAGTDAVETLPVEIDAVAGTV